MPDVHGGSFASAAHESASSNVDTAGLQFEANSSRNAAEGNHWDYPKPDMIIAVMGQTGVGKSTFINTIAEVENAQTGAQVGHTLNSCTSAVQSVNCRTTLNGRRVVLVDTPGFDDTNLIDLDILEIIADWLKERYEQGCTIDGVLYLHRISDNRMAGSPLRLLQTFRDMCGRKYLVNVLLVTTFWDEVSEEEGEARERELRENFWRTMISVGARTARFDGTVDSGREILSRLDSRVPVRRPLLIQEEMVDLHKPLPETAAGRPFFSWLTYLLDKLKQHVKDLRGKRRRIYVIQPQQPELERQDSRIRNEERKIKAVERLIGKYRRPRSPATRSPSPSWSLLSLSSTRSVPNQQPPNTPVDGNLSECGAEVIEATLFALNIIRQLVGLSQIPRLQSVVSMTIIVVEAIQKLREIDPALVMLSRNCCTLISSMLEITHAEITPDIQRLIDTYLDDLRGVQRVVERLCEQSTVHRLFLGNRDRQSIEDCNRQIVFTCSRMTVQMGVIQNAAAQRLEMQLNSVIQILQQFTPQRRPTL